MIYIDFIMGFPMSSWRYDCTMVRVDNFSKITHIFPMRVSYIASSIAHVLLEYIFHLPEFLRQIILDGDLVFILAR